MVSWELEPIDVQDPGAFKVDLETDWVFDRYSLQV